MARITVPSDELARRRTDWMVQAQEGDRDAYRALLEDIRGALTGFLRRRLGDPEEVADVVQETLVSVHRARHTYDPARPFEPWLFTIARHTLVDHMRRRMRQTRWEVLADPTDAVAPEESPVPERLAGALERLPVSQREAFELLKLEGLTVEAAAARAGTSTGALKVRAHRAYKALRALLGG
jgi:RNA polymerase sigma-70 factor (ECF subfamily)